MSAADGARRRVYLDNAATTWPKPEAVLSAAEHFVRTCGATSGRGAYGSALQADRWLEKARVNLAQLIGAPSAGDIALCNSGTHALNAALWGLLRPGDHVVTTSMEHNSLLRPLKQLESGLGITFDVVGSDARGRSLAAVARDFVRENTALLAIGHASNVTGAINDLGAWSDLAKECGAKLLVDASQTLGYVPMDVRAAGIDALAAAGHKGLRALAGTGLLYVARSLQADFRPLMLGGTGRASESIEHAPGWPQAVEVGNLNMPGVVAMAVAAEELLRSEDLTETWQHSFRRLVAGLQQFPQMHLVGFSQQSGQPDWDERVPVVSLLVDGWDIHDLAAILDTSFGIEVRAGWHCAALVHADIGTAHASGTLRMSTGHTTTLEDVDYTLSALHEVLG